MNSLLQMEKMVTEKTPDLLSQGKTASDSELAISFLPGPEFLRSHQLKEFFSVLKICDGVVTGI